MSRPSALLRPLGADDGAALWSLLEPAAAELVGMTSLPTSQAEADALCAASAATLADLAAGAYESPPATSASVTFALIDDATIVGVTALSFKHAVPNLAVEVVTSSDGLGLDMKSTSAPWTRTELNSSYLSPTARGLGLGPLLSRGRFMFIHQVQRQIPSTIASHLRGSFAPDGTAPFWECFGTHFTDSWPDSVAAEQALAEDPARLDDLIGHRRAVRADVLDSLGPVNQASLPAFRLLMREGLRPNGMYDPIDGGPTLVAERDQTVTSQHRRYGRASIVDDPVSPVASLVAVTNVDQFRVVHVPVSVGDDKRISVDEATAATLHINDGALLAIAPIGGTQ